MSPRQPVKSFLLLFLEKEGLPISSKHHPKNRICFRTGHRPQMLLIGKTLAPHQQTTTRTSRPCRKYRRKDLPSSHQRSRATFVRRRSVSATAARKPAVGLPTKFAALTSKPCHEREIIPRGSNRGLTGGESTR